MKILMTGGSGLLGQELQKYLKCDSPTHLMMDITKHIKKLGNYEMIIHCAAYTDVTGAEKEKKQCYLVNVTGTINLLNASTDIPFVYISSEYANKPTNYYAQTKKLAELEVEKRKTPYLIIRTLFKPTPFPFPKAFIDQYTQGDYVDIIAPLIAKEIGQWDRKTSKTLYVGTGRKTIYDLAKRTRQNVIPFSIKEVTTVRLPSDFI
jgi:dTDP-4-dehydrorhamnose reductase